MGGLRADGVARRALTSAVVVLTLILASAAACTEYTADPRPSVQQLLEKSSIWGRPRIRVGVAENEPLMGEYKNDTRSGFDIEIARYLASSLGYQGDARIDFVTVSVDSRLSYLQNGYVDLVVASLSYTEARAKLVGFAGPYLITSQTFLVKTGSETRLQEVEDFQSDPRKTCTSGSSTSEATLKAKDVPSVTPRDVQKCVEGVLDGTYDAVSSDATILAGFLSQHPKDLAMVEPSLGADERLFVGVPITDPALRDLVAYFLEKSRKAGESGVSPWLTAYRNTVGPWVKLPSDVKPTQPLVLDVPDLVDFDAKTSPS